METSEVLSTTCQFELSGPNEACVVVDVDDRRPRNLLGDINDGVNDGTSQA